MIENEELRA